jgi:hypothetical protein
MGGCRQAPPNGCKLFACRYVSLLTTQLREVREEVLKERYPYDGFRRDILHFVDEAVLHTLLSNSVSHTSAN